MKSIRFKTSLLIVAVLTLGSFSGVYAQSDTSATRQASKAGTSDAALIAKNIKDNQMEVEMAQMALDKSQNENIKAVAEVLLRDHSKMLQDLSRLNGGAGMDMHASGQANQGQTEGDQAHGATGSDSAVRSTPGDTGSASNQLDIAGTKTTRDLDTANAAGAMGGADMHSGLANASAEEFDSMWVNQMLTKHKLKLGELHNARNSVSSSQLKEVIRTAIPVIRSHRDMLTDLKNNPDKPVKMGTKSRDGKSGTKNSGRKGSRNTQGSNNQQQGSTSEQ